MRSRILWGLLLLGTLGMGAARAQTNEELFALGPDNPPALSQPGTDGKVLRAAYFSRAFPNGLLVWTEQGGKPTILWRAPKDFVPEGHVGEVKWVDFDRNGKPDLWVDYSFHEGPNHSAIFLNQGTSPTYSDGNFRKAIFPNEAKKMAYLLSPVDLNGDGKAEVLYRTQNFACDTAYDVGAGRCQDPCYHLDANVPDSLLEKDMTEWLKIAGDSDRKVLESLEPLKQEVRAAAKRLTLGQTAGDLYLAFPAKVYAIDPKQPGLFSDQSAQFPSHFSWRTSILKRFLEKMPSGSTTSFGALAPACRRNIERLAQSFEKK